MGTVKTIMLLLCGTESLAVMGISTDKIFIFPALVQIIMAFRRITATVILSCMIVYLCVFYQHSKRLVLFKMTAKCSSNS